MILKRCLGVLLASSALASQVTIHLRDGSEIKGNYAGGTAENVRVEVAGQVMTLPVTSIGSLQFDGAPVSAQPQSGFAHTFTPLAAHISRPLEIPAGTEIVVRMIDAADSARDSVNTTYRASIDQPIAAQDGTVVLPRGADARVILTRQVQSGRLTGKTELTLGLQTVTVDQQKYDVYTDAVTEASSSRTMRTAEVVGGLAATGAIIGGLAGGGRGAAIGSTSGAAAGTLGQVLTSGQRVKVPSETRLSFRLRAPLQVIKNVSDVSSENKGEQR